MIKVALHNLGCKVNSYELDKIAGELIAHGYELADFKEGADVYVINTCTVTNIADRKSRQMLHRAKKLNPNAFVVAIGCYVDTDVCGVRRDPCIDMALSNKEKHRLPELLDKALQKNQEKKESEETQTDIYAAAKSDYRSHTRAYVKIQDGCDAFCSYCVIPYARGRSVSRPAPEIYEEVRALSLAGVKEIVLTGINISSYGLDFEEDAEHQKALSLPFLVKLVGKVPGIERIRLGSLEPKVLTDEALEILASCSKLCPHFHISLQSGCDSVLKRMNRKYTVREVEDKIKKLRTVYDKPAVTADVITGFPGETEEEFKETESFIDETDFYETHVFPYSARERTKAAQMDSQLSAALKSKRADILIKLSNAHAKKYREGFIGKNLSVLSESVQKINGESYITGLTDRYVRLAVPENNERVDPGSVIYATASEFLRDDVLLAKMSSQKTGGENDTSHLRADGRMYQKNRF